jgi:hypothetical protein
LALHRGLAGDPEIRHHEIEELRNAQTGIENECDGNPLLAQPFHDFVNERRFTSTDLASKHNETLTVFDTVRQASERFLGLTSQKQIPRIGIYVERMFS